MAFWYVGVVRVRIGWVLGGWDGSGWWVGDCVEVDTCIYAYTHRRSTHTHTQNVLVCHLEGEHDEDDALLLVVEVGLEERPPRADEQHHHEAHRALVVELRWDRVG